MLPCPAPHVAPSVGVGQPGAGGAEIGPTGTAPIGATVVVAVGVETGSMSGSDGGFCELRLIGWVATVTVGREPRGWETTTPGKSRGGGRRARCPPAVGPPPEHPRAARGTTPIHVVACRAPPRPARIPAGPNGSWIDSRRGGPPSSSTSEVRNGFEGLIQPEKLNRWHETRLYFPSSAIRRWTSSGDTSSMRVPIHHWFPHGSDTPPFRSP